MGIDLAEEQTELVKPANDQPLREILKTLSPTNTTRDTIFSTRKASSIQNKRKS